MRTRASSKRKRVRVSLGADDEAAPSCRKQTPSVVPSSSSSSHRPMTAPAGNAVPTATAMRAHGGGGPVERTPITPLSGGSELGGETLFRSSRPAAGPPPPKPTLANLPDETLGHILSYALPPAGPRRESQMWEASVKIGGACRRLREAMDADPRLAPAVLCLDDFVSYECSQRHTATDTESDALEHTLNSHKKGLHKKKDGGGKDRRLALLNSLNASARMRKHVREIHVHAPGITTDYVDVKKVSRIILPELKKLLTEEDSLPNLNWLDVELSSYPNVCVHTSLVDANTLPAMASALPSLERLCLVECFAGTVDAVTPDCMRRFCAGLRRPLRALTIGSARCLTDEHVVVMMPALGPGLTCLELLDVRDRNHDYLSNIAMDSIASHCGGLETFGFTDSCVTTLGLEGVLRNNPGITTLNLSRNIMLGFDTVDVIASYLPRLEVLRDYHRVGNGNDWLNNRTLMSLVDSLVLSDGAGAGRGMRLRRIGLYAKSSKSDVPSIEGGVARAIECGLKEVEINKESTGSFVSDQRVKVYESKYKNYAAGSRYGDEHYQCVDV